MSLYGNYINESYSKVLEDVSFLEASITDEMNTIDSLIGEFVLYEKFDIKQKLKEFAGKIKRLIEKFIGFIKGLIDKVKNSKRKQDVSKAEKILKDTGVGNIKVTEVETFDINTLKNMVNKRLNEASTPDSVKTRVVRMAEFIAKHSEEIFTLECLVVPDNKDFADITNAMYGWAMSVESMNHDRNEVIESFEFIKGKFRDQIDFVQDAIDSTKSNCSIKSKKIEFLKFDQILDLCKNYKSDGGLEDIKGEMNKMQRTIDKMNSIANTIADEEYAREFRELLQLTYTYMGKVTSYTDMIDSAIKIQDTFVSCVLGMTEF